MVRICTKGVSQQKVARFQNDLAEIRYDYQERPVHRAMFSVAIMAMNPLPIGQRAGKKKRCQNAPGTACLFGSFSPGQGSGKLQVRGAFAAITS